MLTIPFDAPACSPFAVLGDARRVAAIEIRTLTATITELRIEDGERPMARLNAFVDDVGQRTVHVELDPDEYRRALRILSRPGTLVRASGELVQRGLRLMLVHTRSLQFLEPRGEVLGH